jgi:hypothetical protein
MLTKLYYIINLKKLLQVGILFFTEPPCPPLLIEVPGVAKPFSNDYSDDRRENKN